MAIYFNGKNITIWKIEINATKNGKQYARVQASTQKKNRQTEQYETDWSGTIDFWGGAFEKLKSQNVKVKDKINVLNGQYTKQYNKETQKTYENYNVWSGEDFELVAQTETKAKETKAEPDTMQPIDDDDLPF